MDKEENRGDWLEETKIAGRGELRPKIFLEIHNLHDRYLDNPDKIFKILEEAVGLVPEISKIFILQAKNSSLILQFFILTIQPIYI